MQPENAKITTLAFIMLHNLIWIHDQESHVGLADSHPHLRLISICSHYIEHGNHTLTQSEEAVHGIM